MVATVVVPQLITEEEEVAGGGLGGRSADHRAGCRAEGRRGWCRRQAGEKDEAGCEGGRREGWRQERQERQEVETPRDPAGSRPGQPGQGVRAHAPQRRLLAGRALRAANGIALRKDPKFKALVGARTRVAPGSCCRSRFMNASGQPVQMLAGFFRSSPRRCWWCTTSSTYRPASRASSRAAASPVTTVCKDISQRVASHDYWRLRIGIGHPGDKDVVADYVLHKPSVEDKAAIDAGHRPRAAGAARAAGRRHAGGDAEAAFRAEAEAGGAEGTAQEGGSDSRNLKKKNRNPEKSERIAEVLCSGRIA